jgi:hypothetical protein
MQPTEKPGKADCERHRDRGIISLLKSFAVVYARFGE